MNNGIPPLMEYLLCLRPPATLSHLLYSFRQNIQNYLLDTPESGDQVTVMSGRFREHDEEPLISSLAGIELEPFLLTLEKMAFFGEAKRKDLVVLPRPSAELQQLHQEVINISRQFIYWKETPSLSGFHFPQNPERREVHQRYGSPHCGKFYNPHLALGGVKPGLEELLWTPSFIGYEWLVKEFYLMKKDGGWKEVQRFPL